MAGMGGACGADDGLDGVRGGVCAAEVGWWRGWGVVMRAAWVGHCWVAGQLLGLGVDAEKGGFVFGENDDAVVAVGVASAVGLAGADPYGRRVRELDPAVTYWIAFVSSCAF